MTMPSDVELVGVDADKPGERAEIGLLEAQQMRQRRAPGAPATLDPALVLENGQPPEHRRARQADRTGQFRGRQRALLDHRQIDGGGNQQIRQVDAVKGIGSGVIDPGQLCGEVDPETGEDVQPRAQGPYRLREGESTSISTPEHADIMARCRS